MFSYFKNEYCMSKQPFTAHRSICASDWGSSSVLSPASALLRVPTPPEGDASWLMMERIRGPLSSYFERVRFFFFALCLKIFSLKIYIAFSSRLHER